MSIRVSGFTFIKHALNLGYPILESILSIDPLCDEVIINVGFDDPNLIKDDGTYEYLRDHLKHDKYKFIKNYWNPQMKSRGLILSEQTNLALKECRGSICQYIQGDECIHEQDFDAIKQGHDLLDSNPLIDGLVFNYLHFYGNVDTFLHTRRIYRREIRIIRNHKNISSHLDAQGFRYSSGKKIPAQKIDARIFHYGWAREEKVMNEKVFQMDKLYHGDEIKKNQFGYKRIWGLKKFTQTHPHVMSAWIEANKNNFDIDQLPLKLSPRDLSLILGDFIEYLTDYRIGEYKGYILK